MARPSKVEEAKRMLEAEGWVVLTDAEYSAVHGDVTEAALLLATVPSSDAEALRMVMRARLTLRKAATAL